MLGIKSGLAEKLCDMYPDIIVWHCMNHKLELALSDAVDKVRAVNSFQIFIDKIYSVFSKLPNKKPACTFRVCLKAGTKSLDANNAEKDGHFKQSKNCDHQPQINW